MRMPIKTRKPVSYNGYFMQKRLIFFWSSFETAFVFFLTLFFDEFLTEYGMITLTACSFIAFLVSCGAVKQTFKSEVCFYMKSTKSSDLYSFISLLLKYKISKISPPTRTRTRDLRVTCTSTILRSTKSAIGEWIHLQYKISTRRPICLL